LLHIGILDAAGPAPACPEVDEHHFTAELAQGEGASIRGVLTDLRSGTAGWNDVAEAFHLLFLHLEHHLLLLQPIHLIAHHGVEARADHGPAQTVTNLLE